MNKTVDLDAVLDLVFDHQEELAETLDTLTNGSVTYRYFWEEYKHVSKLYDDIRRIGSNDES